MARNSDWTEAKFKRFLAEGRGKGEKDTYRSWLQVSDLASRGRSTRFYSNKEKRVIHVFTDQQLYYALLLEFDESVLSYKEQYPLIDTEPILEQLDEILLKRLKGKDSEIPHVMLTTFLVTAVDEKGEEYQFARTLKDESELNKKPIIERLEIQKRWWEFRNVDFGIVTPNEIPVQQSKNIQWVLCSLNMQDYGFTKGDMESYAEQLEQLLINDQDAVGSVLNAFDVYNKVEIGTGLLVFRYLIATRRILVNMDSEINLQCTANELGISLRQGKEKKKNAVNG
ncbi:TnsA endonuclease C-terminal domain-containing protein [Paenibacillus sp. FSL L8-0709]|uniref:TnsA endonuclease C-terminal domain-containing protein n=1 Tax=Paenibacillus sp. FSL L8-0709 TaxID=2975312 RepID=UPI0030F7FEDF